MISSPGDLSGEEAGWPGTNDWPRACYLLQQGRFVADVCAYYGDDAPNLVPARRLPPTIKPQWKDTQCLHCGRDLPVDLRALDHGYDYDFVNEEVILKRMWVIDGKIVLPDGLSYRMLVLPDRREISPEVLRVIGRLVAEGATVVGPKPERSNSMRGYPSCDDEVRRMADEIWGDCDGVSEKTRAHGKGRVCWHEPLNEVLARMAR